MLEHDIGMLTTVIIGNTSTFVYDNKIITPRGYQRKYTLDADVQKLKPHQRLRKEAEPWSLDQEQTVEIKENKTSLQLATEALAMIDKKSIHTVNKTPILSIFEFAISPGIVNKKFTPEQFMLLANLVGEEGTMEYSRDHQI